MNELLRKLTWLFTRRQRDVELREELAFHLAEEAEQQRAGGLSEEQARAAACRDLGNIVRVAEDTRDVWGWPAVDQVARDVSYSVRQVRRAPLVASVVIATLAVGIGLNTAVFSLVNAVLLRPLPYPESERLVWIAPHDDRFGQDTFASRGDYRIWRQQTQLFDRMSAYGTQDLAVVFHGEASQERVASIDGDIWAITGARPTLGRLLTEDDEQSVVLSFGLFQRRFGGQLAIIGETAEIGGAAFTIVGVLPESFRVMFPQQTAPGDELRGIDAFISLPHGEEPPGTAIRAMNRPAPPWVRVVARLGPGISLPFARTETQALHARLQRDYPRPAVLQRSIRVVSLQEKLAENVRLSLLVLQGAVGFVLLIAVANVANLLLAQASGRMRETAIRAALGASRRRLIFQFLVESAVLALLAGVAATFVAYAAVPVLVGLAPYSVSGLADVTVDGNVLIFALLVSIATSVLFAWAPVFETCRASLLTTLGGTTPTATASSTRMQGMLISFEIALAALLLAAAGLMVKSLWQLQSYPVGFSPTESYTMRIPLSGPRYEELDRKFAYVDELLKRLQNVRGVVAAGIAASTYNLPVVVSGAAFGDPDLQPSVAVRMVSPAYLAAMGVTLVRGRWPSAADALDSVVINETFARSLAPSVDPIGKSISGAFLSGTIVGVAHDFPSAPLDSESKPELYYPWQRAPATQGIAVAVKMDSAAVPTVHGLVEDLDRTQPVHRFQSLEGALEESVAPRRFNMLLLEVYAGSAAALALVGTFGVVTRSVSRRTRETALRIAIGARPSTVVLMIVRQAMAYVLWGIGIGLVATLSAGRIMRGMLFGVEPYDPSTLVLSAVGLAVTALVACWVPAVRAARIDPVVALRQE